MSPFWSPSNTGKYCPYAVGRGIAINESNPRGRFKSDCCYLHTPHFPPCFAQCRQYLQFLQA